MFSSYVQDWPSCLLSQIEPADITGVQLYFLPCDVSIAPVHLSSEELFRAQQMPLQRRAEFHRGRSMLRLVLARLLSVSAADVVIGVDTNGRLYLPQWPKLSISLSHDHGHVLLGVGKTMSLGVDLMQHQRQASIRLIRRICADKEWQAWQALTPTQQTHYFFAIWTIKEALLKCHGGGVWAMSKWCVNFDRDEICACYQHQVVTCDIRYWHLREGASTLSMVATEPVKVACYRLEMSGF